MAFAAIIARNLRELCSASGNTYAVISDGIGITRPQLSRYLSGDSAPNDATIEKICAYFRVPQERLIALPSTGSGLDRACSRVLSSLSDAAPAGLTAGNYFTFYEARSDPGQVLCAVTMIRRRGQEIVFRRLTGFSEKRGTHWSFFRGDHEGIVVERIGHLFFVGLNQIGTREPSILYLRWVAISQPLLAGTAVVMTENGPQATAVAMRPAPKGMSLRAVVREARTHPVGSEHVGPFVRDILYGPLRP